jgi:hypothetical protein
MKLKSGGERCDCCARVGKGFTGFYMPESMSRVTGKPDGRFPGIARADNPSELVMLHACPGCKPKVDQAVKFFNFSFLPDGPLRKIVTQLMTRDRLKRFKIIQ